MLGDIAVEHTITNFRMRKRCGWGVVPFWAMFVVGSIALIVMGVHPLCGRCCCTFFHSHEGMLPPSNLRLGWCEWPDEFGSGTVRGYQPSSIWEVGSCRLCRSRSHHCGLPIYSNRVGWCFASESEGAPTR